MIHTSNFSLLELTLNQLTHTHIEQRTRLRRLSTGERINQAEEDSASLSISTKLGGRIRGQVQALANIESVNSFLSIKEQGLNTINELLLKMQEKAIQAGNDTLGEQERRTISRELEALSDEVFTVIDSTEYNDKAVFARGITNVQIGEGSTNILALDSGTGDPINVSLGNIRNVIAATDFRSGTGYIMYTEERSQTRFGAPGFSAEQLVTVTYSNGQWYYDNNGSDSVFIPESTDHLVASVDFNNDTVTPLEGVDREINGISAGFVGGDIMLAANENNFGGFDFGDFGVQGTNVLLPPLPLAEAINLAYLDLNISTPEDAQAIQGSIDAALDIVLTTLQDVGEQQLNLRFREDTLNISNLNLIQADGRITDADFAKEQVELIKLQILQNAGVAALTQAISNRELILQLL